MTVAMLKYALQRLPDDDEVYVVCAYPGREIASDIVQVSGGSVTLVSRNAEHLNRRVEKAAIRPFCGLSEDEPFTTEDWSKVLAKAEELA